MHPFVEILFYSCSSDSMVDGVPAGIQWFMVFLLERPFLQIFKFWTETAKWEYGSSWNWPFCCFISILLLSPLQSIHVTSYDHMGVWKQGSVPKLLWVIVIFPTF